MKREIERRNFVMDSIHVERRGEGETPIIRGHAAVFDKLSENLGGFREQIQAGAFDEVLRDDVRALFNHDPNIILGRVGAKTLRVGVDKTGLWYEIDPPDTQAGRDLLISLERGDIRESSFAFIVENDDWNEDEEGRVVRTITKFRQLFDVSPVTYPAYPDTDVGRRSMEAWLEERRHAAGPDWQTEQRQRELRLAEIS